MNFVKKALASILVLGAGYATGAFLGLVGERIAGGGHGWEFPVLIFLGLAALVPSSLTVIGGALYGAIASVVTIEALQHRARRAVIVVLAFHYISVLAAALYVYTIGPANLSDGLDASWRYMRHWIIASGIVFIVVNALAVSIVIWPRLFACRSHSMFRSIGDGD